jgi:four helix bundle protein
MNRFKELLVWQKSVELTTEIYKLTTQFPKEEKYGLISQITRSAISIPSNIAEGAGRNSKGEFHQFLGISIGSSFELETQLIVAKNLEYISEVQLEQISFQLQTIQNMIFKLQKTLK